MAMGRAPLIGRIRPSRENSDSVRGKLVAGILYGGLNPVFAFPNRPLRKTNGREGGKTLRNINLHIYNIALYSDHCAAEDFSQHKKVSPEKFRVFIFNLAFTFNNRNVIK
jgi:hypothetical protein